MDTGALVWEPGAACEPCPVWLPDEDDDWLLGVWVGADTEFPDAV
jgi:hypothetical protein